METIRNFDELVTHLSDRTERRRVAVVCPNDESTQYAVCRALDEGIVDAILVGCNAEAKSVFAKYSNVEYVEADDADDAARRP